MEIKVLDQDVVNQIAAGEVAERPANIVKELVENSIDANATLIEVDIQNGGRSLRIKDNGHGMPKEQLQLALTPHATSKIKEAADIWKLDTFGFRGEALASISSVSDFKLSSKTNIGKGYSLRSKFGQIDSPIVTGVPEGTQIQIDDLFNNVPARLKFLKSDAAETTQIKKVLKAMALAHPKVSFQIKSQGKLMDYWSVQDSWKKRCEVVLGVKNLHSIKDSLNGFDVEVVFSSPNQTVSSRQSIWTFVQNRWVQDKSLMAAVLESYRNLLMHGEYPIVVLKVKCDPEFVDVNISPTKSQVKFKSSQDAFRAVNKTLRGAIEKAPWLNQLLGDAVNENKNSIGIENIRKVQPENLELQDQYLNHASFQKKNYSPNIGLKSPGLTLDDFRSSSEGERSSREYIDISTETATYQTQLGEPAWGKLEVLGQAHMTYIVAQSRKSLILIDQHASHERVVFEKLMSQWKNGDIEIQNFLLPLSLDFEEEQIEALMAQSEAFSKLGIEIEKMGPLTLSVRSAPTILKEKALVQAIQKVSRELIQQGESFAIEKIVGDICATLACHSVIRAGQALSEEEMKNLLVQMDEYPLSSFCPHGRPVFVEYSFYQLDKSFGRLG